MDLYSTAQVSRLLRIPEGRLRWWRRCGLVVPGGREGGRKLYTFNDLVSLKAAKELTDLGHGAKKIRKVINALAADLGSVRDPLIKLRVYGNDRRLVIDQEGCDVDAETGQLLIDFRVSPIAEAADRTVAFDPSGRSAGEEMSAYGWFEKGCDLEADPQRLNEAEDAFRRALELDGSLAAAATNLGNLLFRRGNSREAEKHYRKAIQADPDQPQAYYNLGFLKLDGGRADLAIVFFQKTLTLDPTFSDARFNLAVALEQEGRLDEARREFGRFLRMDPTSPWARVARLHLERIDGGTIP
jgi:tetratricopeptide (TPR) repeat protein